LAELHDGRFSRNFSRHSAEREGLCFGSDAPLGFSSIEPVKSAFFQLYEAF
jgi:hypothetical protein